MATLLLAALPEVARTLMAGLEQLYTPRPADDCPRAVANVLHGGAIRPLLAGEVRGCLHRGFDRVWEAAELWHAGCVPWVVVSAEGQIKPSVAAGESAALADSLLGLGVPANALLVEADSRTTPDNANFTRAVLAPLGGRRVLLVTAAWHLRRAEALFVREGLEVLPVGADYRGFRSCRGLECWVPSTRALEETGLVVKEYLGYGVAVGWRGDGVRTRPD